jgi:hypothetical protein
LSQPGDKANWYNSGAEDFGHHGSPQYLNFVLPSSGDAGCREGPEEAMGNGQKRRRDRYFPRSYNWGGQLSPASPVLGQNVLADHDPADDLGHIQSDFELGLKAHLQSPQSCNVAAPTGCEMRPTRTNEPSLMGSIGSLSAF